MRMKRTHGDPAVPLLNAQVLDRNAPTLDGPRVVVVAVDDSPTAFRAASYAAGLARRNRSVLMLLHVRKPPPSAIWIDAVGNVPIQPGSDGSALLDQLAELAHEQYGIVVKRSLCDGSPVKEIVRIANEVHADAVVIGCSHSRLHRVMGSMSARLLRRGMWPITVVP